jgi:pimeloyl-ACP methyl ester carboxylesterase
MQGRLAAVDVPTLCIAGEKDAASPSDVVRMMAKAIPGATVATLPGAPHMMHWETPSALATEIARFLTHSVAGR